VNVNMIANSSIEVDSNGQLFMNYNQITVGTPTALLFQANGQQSTDGQSLTVSALNTANGAISLSAGSAMEVTGTSINVGHLGGAIGSLTATVSSASNSRAQIFMQAGAPNSNGNSIEVRATNGAVSIQSTQGYGVFETDGVLQVRGETSVTLGTTFGTGVANTGDISISSSQQITFVANTVSNGINPPTAIVLQASSSTNTANMVFFSQSDVNWEAGNNINTQSTGNVEFFTRQKGILTVSSEYNLGVTATTFTASSFGNYGYLRGFQGVTISGTNRVGFNGVVGIVANDRNKRLINRDKNLIVNGLNGVYVLSQAVFFADIDIPNESRMVIPLGTFQNCATGQFAYDQGAKTLFICGGASVVLA